MYCRWFRSFSCLAATMKLAWDKHVVELRKIRAKVPTSKLLNPLRGTPLGGR